MAREYPEAPVVGVGALIVRRDGDGVVRVVLIRRGNPPLEGHWSLPGGVLELGETVAEGVVREAREETGLEVSAGVVVGTYDRIVRDDEGWVRYHYVLIDLLCAVTGGELRAGGDAADARWVSEVELPSFALVPETELLVRRVLSTCNAE